MDAVGITPEDDLQEVDEERLHDEDGVEASEERLSVFEDFLDQLNGPSDEGDAEGKEEDE
jgi:hypothetical protein